MRALVLSGGGAKGAYQVGVLRRWLSEERRQYDVLCGVSVGALNASFLAQFPIGQESASWLGLHALWDALHTSDVRVGWSVVGRLAGLWKPSFYCSAPLRALVKRSLDPAKVRASGRKLRVGAVSLSSGKYAVFEEDCADLHSAVLASSSFPVFLEPVSMVDELWTDGGLRDVTPIRAAIQAGATEIDVVICSPAIVDSPLAAHPNALRVAARAIDVLMDEVIQDDVKIAQLYNRLVACGESNKIAVKMQVIQPARSLPTESLDFDPATAARLMAIGYADSAP